jgi:hypothetical protein
MTTSDEFAHAEEAPGRWQSLLSSLKVFAQALDYDLQEENYALLSKPGASVSQLEARLIALEQQAITIPVPAFTDNGEER